MAHILSSVSGAATDLLKIQRALISVSDKTLLIPLATYLHEQHVEILSTGDDLSTLNSELTLVGGTAAAMRNAGEIFVLSSVRLVLISLIRDPCHRCLRVHSESRDLGWSSEDLASKGSR